MPEDKEEEDPSDNGSPGNKKWGINWILSSWVD
jgi:hypothetical protein